MAVPEHIRKIARPSNTIVKQRGERYVVIKRTSRRVGKRVLPVDLGTIGEIIDGQYVPRVETPKKKTIDVKDYGEVAVCHKYADGLLQELAKVWDLKDAKRLYTMAVLRAAYGDVKSRDMQLHYETSFMSEIIPGVHLSEQAISAFLQEIGQSYSFICEFMRNRVADFAGKNIIVDGMLKDYNSQDGYFSEFSRKARTKGSKDMSLLYAFNPETKEPIAAKPYPGNMLDQTAITNFVSEFKIDKGLMIGDKGFFNKEFLEELDKKEGLSYMIPLKQNSRLIKKYGMDEPTELLSDYKDATILCKKVKMSGGGFLYSFRDPRMAYEQEVGYVQKLDKKDEFDSDKYTEKKSQFGLVVFKSKQDVSPLIVYLAYSQRWMIEILFNLYKNIMERDTVNVHTDYRVYATELINFLSVIITTRIKNELVKKEINKKHSYKQVFKFLSTYKKARVEKDGEWMPVTMLKSVQGINEQLGV